MAEPVRAKSLSCSHCKHGSVFIHLHGADGEIIATASMDAQTAVDFGDDFTAETEKAVELLVSGQAAAGPELH